MKGDALTAEKVYLAKADIALADELIRDYLPFIRFEASKAAGRVVTEQDDEMSVAMIAFHHAIESYSRFRGAFLSYAAVVIRRGLIDWYRKEKRHRGIVSLDGPVNSDGDGSVGDTVADGTDEYERTGMRDAARQEIEELTAQLKSFDVSLADIAGNSPKQLRTLAACHRALGYARENPELISELKQSKRLPIAKLCAGSGVERKTLERHRKYLLALLVIYSNGYEIIRGHLKQVFISQKGGVTA